MHARHLLVILLAVLAPEAARADGKKLSPAAQAHLDAGLKAYADKQFDQAGHEFDLAYQIDPDPSLLYAGAQALRLGSNCKRALELYRQYLETKPKDEQVTAANTGIQQCEAKLAAAEPKPKPEPVVVKPEPVKPVVEPLPVEPKPVHDTPRWYMDPIGGALVGGGAIGIGVGIGLYVSGKSAEDRSKTAEFRDDFQALLDKATSRKRLGAIGISAGIGLAVGGVLVYKFRAHKSSTVVGSTGQTIFIAGAF